MSLEIVGIREQLERHLWSYYHAQLSSINCRREWTDFVIDHRNRSMDINHRAFADRVFPITFNGVSFEEFQVAVENRKGQIDDIAIVEVLEKLSAEKSQQQEVKAE